MPAALFAGASAPRKTLTLKALRSTDKEARDIIQVLSSEENHDPSGTSLMCNCPEREGPT